MDFSNPDLCSGAKFGAVCLPARIVRLGPGRESRVACGKPAVIDWSVDYLANLRLSEALKSSN